MPVQLVRCNTPPFASGRETRLQRWLSTESTELGMTRQKEQERLVWPNILTCLLYHIKYGSFGACVWEGGGQTNKKNSFGYSVMEFANEYFTPKLTACTEQNAILILKHTVCTGICFLL